MTLSYRKTVNRVDKSISPTRQKMNLKKELLQALEGSKWHPENPKRNSLKKSPKQSSKAKHRRIFSSK